MHYKTWGHHRHYRGGFFFPGMVLLILLLVFGFKFLLPLLFIGFALSLFFRGSHFAGSWRCEQHTSDLPKRKNDEVMIYEKPKRGDDGEPRYIRTADGEWVEIV